MPDIASTRRQFMGGAGALALVPAMARAAKTVPIDPLLAMPARALAGVIAARQASCEEVMRASLAQIGRHNPAHNAVVALQDGDALLAQARSMDQRRAAGDAVGPLFGLPWAVKDLQSVIGIRSTSGSLILKDNVPKTEGIMVQRLRAAGAVFVGKTNAPEFGLGSHTINRVYGPTRGAYDLARSAGGSSGGAAAALALRMLPLADGSDFGGSLRNPAAWNNVFGFRTGIGVIPQDGAEQWLSRMSVSGPMARNVGDLALLLSVQAGKHPLSPQSLDVDPKAFLAPLDHDAKGTRIGWLGDWGGRVPHDPAVLAVCAGVIPAFKAIGCTVEEAEVPVEVEPVWQALQTLRSWVSAAPIAAYADNPATRDLLGPQAQWEIANARGLTAARVLAASQVRTAFSQAFDRLFDRFDFLVMPSAQVFPFPVEQLWPTQVAGQTMRTYHEWMLGNFLITMTGLPALAAPAGFGPGGLPAGIQIVGRRGAEMACLKMAHAYEQAAKSVINRLPPALA
jgi:amidase